MYTHHTHIHQTQTTVGAKYLRASLLSPLTDRTTLEARLDLVELLVAADGYATAQEPSAIDCIQVCVCVCVCVCKLIGGWVGVSAAAGGGGGGRVRHCAGALLGDRRHACGWARVADYMNTNTHTHTLKQTHIHTLS